MKFDTKEKYSLAVLRLLDCDLCDVKNGSIVNCNFSSSSEPKVKLDNQLVEVVGFDNYSYVVPVPIRGQPRQLMISNGYSSPILVECESFVFVT